MSYEILRRPPWRTSRPERGRRPGPVGMRRRPRLPHARRRPRSRTPSHPVHAGAVARDGGQQPRARPTSRSTSSTARTSRPRGGKPSSRRRSMRWCSRRSRTAPPWPRPRPRCARPRRTTAPTTARRSSRRSARQVQGARQRYPIFQAEGVPGGLYGQPVHRRARPLLHAGHLRRQPARARGRACGDRLPALPGRGHVAEPDVQRRRHRDPGGLAARAAAGHARRRRQRQQARSR